MARSVKRGKSAIPSVMQAIARIPVGRGKLISKLAENCDVKEASVISVALACNSNARSNQRYFGTGMRFERQGNRVVRTA